MAGSRSSRQGDRDRIMSPVSIHRLAVLASGLAALTLPRLAPGQQISVQTPTFGVSIDADGVLTAKSYPDPTGRLFAKRLADARVALPADIRGWSDIRKVSLVGL